MSQRWSAVCQTEKNNFKLYWRDIRSKLKSDEYNDYKKILQGHIREE